MKIVAQLVIAGCIGNSAAHAQTWPTTTVRIIVPYAPGGTTDIAARVLAQELTPVLGQQVIVENRAGAATRLGSELVAKAPADGHTLLLTAAPFAINPALYPQMAYDTLRDFEPVSLVVQNALVLLAHPTTGSANVADLLARAKKDETPIASAGNGSMSHMSIELLASITGAKLLHIAYKGSGQALPHVISGQVPFMFDNPSSALPHVKSGRLRAIAYTGPKRSSALPDVPTVMEAGITGFQTLNWFGLLAPAKTPSADLDRLNAEVVKVLRKPDVVARFIKDGVDVAPSTRAEFSEFIRTEVGKWAQVVKTRNIKAD